MTGFFFSNGNRIEADGIASIRRGEFNRTTGKWKYIMSGNATALRGPGAANIHFGVAMGVSPSGFYTGVNELSPDTTYYAWGTCDNFGRVNDYYGPAYIFKTPKAPPTAKVFNVPLFNPSAIDVTIKIYEIGPDQPANGSLVASVQLAPGEKKTVTIRVASGNGLQFIGEAYNAALDANGNLVAGTGFYTWNAGKLSNFDGETDSDAGNTNPTTQQTPEGNSNPTNFDPNSRVSVKTDAVPATSDTTALDKKTYVDGVNGMSSSIVSAVDRVNETLRKGLSVSVSGGSSGGTVVDARPNIDAVKTSVDGVKTSVDGVKTGTDRLKENSDKIREDFEAQVAAIPENSAMEGAANAASSAVLTALGTLPSTGVASVPSSAPNFAITLPLPAIGDVEFDLNPFTPERFGGVAAFLRSLATWLLVMGFAGWAALQSREALTAMLAAQQARGNTIAGSGAQVTALIAAGLITTAVASGFVAIVGWKDLSLAGTTAVSALGTDPLSSASGAVAGGVWMLDQVFPVATAFACLAARLTYQFTLTLAVASVSTVVRFFVP